jgi:hypothetical protein
LLQLSQLRALVGKAISLQCGGEVTLWQDTVTIDFGADWAANIEQAVSQTTFFIPIVTPNFLKSDYCFREFTAFRNRMIALGRSDLIFPVHYVRVDHMRAEDTVFGEGLAELRRHQWTDFTPLFHAEPRSAEVRKWAGDLAASVLKALRRPAPPQPPVRAPQSPTAGPGDAKAQVERLAAPPEPITPISAAPDAEHPRVALLSETPAEPEKQTRQKRVAALAALALVGAGAAVVALRSPGLPASSGEHAPAKMQSFDQSGVANQPPPDAANNTDEFVKQLRESQARLDALLQNHGTAGNDGAAANTASAATNEAVSNSAKSFGANEAASAAPAISMAEALK